MTPQDTQILQAFLDGLTRAQVATKDHEAEILIARAFAQQPDAAYLVVQRAVLLEQALKRAQAQIAQPGAAPATTEALSPRAAPQSPQAGSPWSSFLGNAAATAAGVAGGAFLFQGIENLVGHGSGSSATNGPAETVENITVNDYRGDGDPAGSVSENDALDDLGIGDSSGDASWT